jgi:hypothetical protein
MSTRRPLIVISSTNSVRVQRRLVRLRSANSPDSGEVVNVWRPSLERRAAEDVNRPLNLFVRGARVTDLPGLVRISNVQTLNQPDVMLVGFSRLRSGIRSVAPIARSKPYLFVASVEDRLVGFAEFQPSSPDRRWHAIAIGTATGVFDSGPVEDELLRHAITAAGLRGVKRLFARVPSGAELIESFNRVGFSPYATETIFVAEQPRSLATESNVRRQERTDTWAIHQLHNATVPRQVQYAEAITSHRWDLRGRDELARSRRRLGWLVDDGVALCAYGRVASGDRAHALELIYAPERTDALAGLIDRILTELTTTAGRTRVFCTLRGYQVEAAKELELRGFEPILEQDLLVKYTTATARAPHFEPLPLHSEVVERLPKRVPSFLSQTPTDEKAG